MNCRNDSLRVFIFDVDGVIADTAQWHLAAWRRLAEAEGLAFDDRIARALRGLGREASLRKLLNGRPASPEQFAAMAERKNQWYLSLVENLDERAVMPGVLPLLADLRDSGIRLAAASASRNARWVLERLGVTPSFEAIVDGCEVAVAKPAPDLFLRAAARLRVLPEACVVVEDAASGVAAARAAGMRCVGLGEAGDLAGADVVVGSLDGVRAAWILDRLGVSARSDRGIDQFVSAVARRA